MAQGGTSSGTYRDGFDPEFSDGLTWHYVVSAEGRPPSSSITIVGLDERSGGDEPTVIRFSIPSPLLGEISSLADALLDNVGGP